MAYEFRYVLEQAPEARSDGSGMVAHNIHAEASLDGDNWAVVPARSKTFNIPASELQTVMEAGNTAQIVAAYKNALIANLNTLNEPLTGWGLDQLEELMTNNAAALSAATAADAFIDGIANYPVSFTI